MDITSISPTWIFLGKGLYDYNVIFLWLFSLEAPTCKNIFINDPDQRYIFGGFMIQKTIPKSRILIMDF